MENQMRICFVTLEQFNKIWSKSFPADRFTGELTTLNMMQKRLNTLFIVGKEEDFLASVDQCVAPSWLISGQE